MRKFEAQRRAEKRRVFQSVLRLGVKVATAGSLLYVASQSLLSWSQQPVAYAVTYVAGVGVAIAGILVMTSAPPSLLDMDDLMAHHLKHRVSFAAGFSPLSMADAIEPPHVNALGLLPILAAVLIWRETGA